MNSDLLQGFYLRDLLVDPLKGQVAGQAGSVHLPPKAMETLLVLASSPGTLISRETLLEEVWGAGRGSQEALNHAISEIRHALEDHADNPSFVQTLPKRGYRLITEAVPITATTSSIVIGTQGGPRVGEIGLFENLKRRGVLETGIAYLVVGWLVIQIADTVFDQLLLPPWIGTFVTVLVIAGFPIAIVLSWYLEVRKGRAVVHTLSPKDAFRHRFSITYISIIGAMAIAGLFVFVYDMSIGLPEAELKEAGPISADAVLPPIPDNSIAVLPFLNRDESDQTRIFANGLSDDLITRLSRVPGLLVSSRGDSFTLEPNSTSQKVRERLRVALYLQGSVQIAGDELRITAQLIDSATSFHTVARSFDRPLKDFFDIRDEITELTVANIRVALPPEAQLLPVADFEEANLNAYVLYRTGKEIFDKPRTLDSIAEILGYYEQALELDPEYAAAHAGICDAYVARYEVSNSVDDIERAENACASALDSNPRLDMVYTALGRLYRRTGRTSDAEEAFDVALRINPQNAEAMSILASVYRQQQKYVDAERLLHTAIATQPGNWRRINSLGGFLFAMGRYSEAADAYRQVVFIDAENYQARTNLGGALTMAGDFEAGQLVLEQSLDIGPSPTAYSNLGVIYYYLGEFDKSVTTHREAINLSPKETVKWINLADALHFAGQGQEADAAFRRAVTLAESRIAVDPSDSETLTLLAWAEQMLGESRKAKDTIARSLAVSPDDPYGYYYDALINLQTGDDESALQSLRFALDKGYPAKMLAAEPYLEELRANREFQSMIFETR